MLGIKKWLLCVLLITVNAHAKEDEDLTLNNRISFSPIELAVMQVAVDEFKKRSSVSLADRFITLSQDKKDSKKYEVFIHKKTDNPTRVLSDGWVYGSDSAFVVLIDTTSTSIKIINSYFIK